MRNGKYGFFIYCVCVYIYCMYVHFQLVSLPHTNHAIDLFHVSKRILIDHMPGCHEMSMEKQLKFMPRPEYTYKSLDPRNMDQSTHSCLLFEGN